jgi:hypothetical protein
VNLDHHPDLDCQVLQPSGTWIPCTESPVRPRGNQLRARSSICWEPGNQMETDWQREDDCAI